MLFLFICFLSSCFSSNSKYTEVFKGIWEWDDSHGNTFELVVFQKEDSIKGTHCAVFYNGEKIDCSYKEEITFNGIVLNNTADVYFISGFSNSRGKAKLSIINNSIKWEIIQPPKEEYYLPKKAILNQKVK